MQKWYGLLKIASCYLYRSARGHVLTDRMTCCSMQTTALCDLTKHTLQSTKRAHHAHSAHTLSTLPGPRSRPYFSFLFLELLSVPLASSLSSGFVCVFGKYRKGWRSWRVWSLGSQTLCCWMRWRWSSLWRIWSWGKAWDAVREGGREGRRVEAAGGWRCKGFIHT